jgi:hypothetical protein
LENVTATNVPGVKPLISCGFNETFWTPSSLMIFATRFLHSPNDGIASDPTVLVAQKSDGIQRLQRSFLLLRVALLPQKELTQFVTAGSSFPPKELTQFVYANVSAFL